MFWFRSCRTFVNDSIYELLLRKENVGGPRSFPLSPVGFSSLYYGDDYCLQGQYPFARYCVRSILYDTPTERIPVGVFAYKKSGFYTSGQEYGCLLLQDHKIEAIRESGYTTTIYDNGTQIGDYTYSKNSLLFDLGHVTFQSKDSTRTIKVVLPFFFGTNQFFGNSCTNFNYRMKGKVYDTTSSKQYFYTIQYDEDEGWTKREIPTNHRKDDNIFGNVDTSSLTTNELLQLLFLFPRSLAYYRRI